MYTYININVCMCVYIYIYIDVYMYMYVYVYVCVCVYIYIYSILPGDPDAGRHASASVFNDNMASRKQRRPFRRVLCIRNVSYLHAEHCGIAALSILI